MCVGDGVEEGHDDGKEEEHATLKSPPADVESVISAAVAAAEEKGERLQWLELDELGITDTDLHGLNLAAKCPVIPSRSIVVTYHCFCVSHFQLYANSDQACALVGVGFGWAQPLGQPAGIGGRSDEFIGRSPQLARALAQSDTRRLE